MPDPTPAPAEDRPTPQDMLARLVGFDTTSRNSNLALIGFVEALLGAYGIETERFPNTDGTKTNLFATIGPDEPGGVILSGHTDVVPVDGQAWSSDPFTVTEREGRLYGRGTCDMKGFIATALALLPEMTAAPLTRPIHLALSYDEEVGCTGVQDMVAWLAARDPKPGLCIVGEPTMMRVVTGHKGIRGFRTTVTGQEAHSSLTHQGANAVQAAARLIAFLDDLADEMAARGDPSGRFDPPYTTLQAGMIRGGTAINIVPRDAVFEWEHRVLPGQDPEEILRRFTAFAEGTVLPRLQRTAPGASITTEELANAPPLAPEPGCAAEELARALTGQNESLSVSFATEGGLFQGAGIPTVICGPGSIEQAHKPDEFVAVSQLDACAAFMRKLIARLSAAETL